MPPRKSKREKIETYVIADEVGPMGLEPTGERQIGHTLDRIAPDHRKRYEWAARYITENVGPGSFILDAGCGNGYGSFILASAGHTVHAVDCSDQAVCFAQEHYRNDHVWFQIADLGRMDTWPESETKYDAVVCFEALEHIDAEAVVPQFFRAAPLLLASVPNENVIPYSSQTHPFHKRHYTPDQLSELLRDYTITDWHTQDDKWIGDIRGGNNGRTLIVGAKKI